jgi:hypothetical protein
VDSLEYTINNKTYTAEDLRYKGEVIIPSVKAAREIGIKRKTFDIQRLRGSHKGLYVMVYGTPFYLLEKFVAFAKNYKTQDFDNE